MNLAVSKPTNTFSTHPSSLFPEITTCKTMKDLNQVHAKFIKTGQIHDPLAAAEFLKISTLSDHHRDLNYASKVFSSIDKPNCFSYNTMIRAFAEGETPIDALLTFHRMISDGFVEPNQYTFPSVFKACSRTERIEEGKQFHGLTIKYSVDCDEFVVSNLVRMYVVCGVMEIAHKLFNKNVVKFNNGFRGIVDKRKQDGNVVLLNVMIDGYVRLGDFESAKELFDKMPQRTIVSWNTMIAGYAQNGHFKEALDIFHEMQMSDICPNYVTLVSVLPAISRLGGLELGKWVHLYIEKNNLVIDDVLGSALVDMYSKCGNIEKALQIFEKLPQQNAITWNAIISGLAMHGRANDALNRFSKMEQAGVTPTDVTYIGILTACSHAGLVNEGRSFFNHMINNSVFEPRIEHYGCMVDLLSRAGLLEEAEELIMNMPIKPDDVIWKALLGGCKMHGNVEMGERIADHLMKTAPNDSGAYVALSNMHASLGNWQNVSEVRLKMKNMKIKKDPGCSWTELDGVVHEFVVEDDSHARAKDIRSMLEEISSHLRLSGYKPNTTQVLLNMDEEDKEKAIHYHSEKIAVAFGLISTNAQMDLRIVKNLRMCDDCHASFKLISKIYKRKIIVRDRKRFHHFEKGACSCMDYW